MVDMAATAVTVDTIAVAVVADTTVVGWYLRSRRRRWWIPWRRRRLQPRLLGTLVHAKRSRRNTSQTNTPSVSFDSIASLYYCLLEGTRRKKERTIYDAMRCNIIRCSMIRFDSTTLYGKMYDGPQLQFNHTHTHKTKKQGSFH